MAGKKQKKKTASKKERQTKKTVSAKNLIVGAVVTAIVAAVTVLIVMNAVSEHDRHVLRHSYWVSQTARTASGDEADIREVYNVKYDNYRGRLEFDGENRFELWLSPGDAEDGTHSGVYEINGDKADVTFDSGDKAVFSLIRSDGAVTGIELEYDGYTVGFVPNDGE